MGFTVTDCEDLELAQLDARIRVQLARAAEAHASAIDLDARLIEALRTGSPTGDDAAADASS